MDVILEESIMRIQVTEDGKTIDGKEIMVINYGLGVVGEDRSLALLIDHDQRLANVFRKHQSTNPKTYLFNKIIYIDVDGDKYHYVFNLNRDTYGVAEQFMREKKAIFGVLAPGGLELEFSAEDVIIL